MSRNNHAVGLAVTIFLHAGLVGLVLGQGQSSSCGGGDRAEASGFDDAQTIEASLAFKKVSPKNNQPQKQRKEKYQPPAELKVSHDPGANPDDADAGPRHLVVNNDEIDPASVLQKHHTQDDDLSSTGVLQQPRDGSDTGSEWGTEKDAKGDPYVGELKGRVYSAWSVPSLETGAGKAVGCVRLDQAGKIVDRQLKERSENANLNRSVEVALKEAPDMDKPVPDPLVTLLTVKGICFNFKLEQ